MDERKVNQIAVLLKAVESHDAMRSYNRKTVINDLDFTKLPETVKESLDWADDLLMENALIGSGNGLMLCSEVVEYLHKRGYSTILVPDEENPGMRVAVSTKCGHYFYGYLK